MSLSIVLDVLIALSALFVALSCLCSWINESIQSLLQKRSSYLYKGILDLVCDQEGLANAIFSSPFITPGAKAEKNPEAPRFDWKGLVTGREHRPSYAAPRSFSLALWDAVRTEMPSPGVVTNALQAPTALIGDLRSSVSGFNDNSRLKTSLVALLNQAQGDYEKLLSLTDAWFNGQMNRVSGWYKRYSQWFILAISIVVVSVLGVDSIEFATVLRTRGDLRTLTTAVAAAIPTPEPTPAPGATWPPHDTRAAQENVAQAVYRSLSSMDFGGAFHARWSPTDILGTWREHWAGMLVTIVALMLGTPFWFDLLSLLVNVRLAGAKPDPSKVSNASSQ